MIKVVVRGNYVELTKKKLNKADISKGVEWINDYKQELGVWKDSSTKEMNDFYDWITKDSESVLLFNTDNLFNSSPFFGIRVFDESDQLIATANLSDIEIAKSNYNIWGEPLSDGDAFSASCIYDFELCFLLERDAFSLDKLKFVRSSSFLIPDALMGGVIMYDGEIIHRTIPTSKDKYPFDKKNPSARALYYDGFFVCQDNEYYVTYKCGGLERLCPTEPSAPKMKISIMGLNGGFGLEDFPRADYVLTDEDHSRFLKQFPWHNMNGDIALQSPIGRFPAIPKKYNYEKEDIFKYEIANVEAYFEIQKDFTKEIFYDLSDEKQYAAYAFILFFDLVSSFKYNKSLSNLYNQISVLAQCCPKISDYIDAKIVDSVYYDLEEDISKHELLQLFPNCKKYLNVYEYARIVLEWPEKDLTCLKGLVYCSPTFVMISKTNEKKFKVTNEVIIDMFFHILAFVIAKYNDFDSLIGLSLKLKAAHKSKDLSGKRMIKSKKDSSLWPFDKPTFYMDIVERLRKEIYEKLNITNVGGNYEWPGKSMGHFSAVQFDEYISEALDCYDVYN